MASYQRFYIIYLMRSYLFNVEDNKIKKSVYVHLYGIFNSWCYSHTYQKRIVRL
jgi:hypothetical protein